MNIETLRTLLMSKNYDAPECARALGPPAVPLLIESLSNADQEVRLIAVNSLRAVESSAAIPGFARALEDTYQPVRNSAVNSLWDRHDASILPELHAGLRANPNRDTRAQIPLIIGLIGERSSVSVLQEALEVESDKEVGTNIRLAMARLGEATEQQACAERLESKDTGALLKAIQDVVYVNDRSVGRSLAPLLRDRRPAYRVGVSAARREARICDAAINATSEIYRRPFSFQVDRNSVYADGQIAEVVRFFRELPD